MTQTPRVIYRARGDATTEAEASALANVYRLILDSAKQRDRLLNKSGPEDEGEIAAAIEVARSDWTPNEGAA